MLDFVCGESAEMCRVCNDNQSFDLGWTLDESVDVAATFAQDMHTWWEHSEDPAEMPNPAQYFGDAAWGAAEAVLCGVEVYWDYDLGAWTDGEVDLREFPRGTYADYYFSSEAEESVSVAVEAAGATSAAPASTVSGVTVETNKVAADVSIAPPSLSTARQGGYDAQVYQGVLPSFMLGAPGHAEPFRMVKELSGGEGTYSLHGLESLCVDMDPIRVQSELVDAGFVLEGPVKKMGRGWNAIVVVSVGAKKFRCVIDTGAARSLIRTSFAIDLAKDPSCSEYVRGFFRGDRMIRIEGVHKDQAVSDSSLVNVVCSVVLQFLTGGPTGTRKTGPPIEVEFGCLGSCADAMIIGMPELARWGLKVENDRQDQCYVEILKYGVRASVEKEKR